MTDIIDNYSGTGSNAFSDDDATNMKIIVAIGITGFVGFRAIEHVVRKKIKKNRIAKIRTEWESTADSEESN